MPAPTTSLRILRERNFALYFVGNLASNCGTWFQNIAQALLIFRLTHSAVLVGVVNFAQFLGTFLLAPWAGSAADRFDRRKLLVVSQIRRRQNKLWIGRGCHHAHRGKDVGGIFDQSGMVACPQWRKVQSIGTPTPGLIDQYDRLLAQLPRVDDGIRPLFLTQLKESFVE